MAEHSSTAFSILLVDDEPGILRGLTMMFSSAGFQNVTSLQDSRDVMPTLESRKVDVMVLDLQMPHVSGLEILVEARRRFPEIPVLILTANTDLERAVECMRLGAYDYHVKPVDPEKLLTSVRRARQASDLRHELTLIRNEFLDGCTGGDDAPFSALVTVNDKMRNRLRYARVLAQSAEPILLCGETGTGKDLLANAIHSASDRKGPFVRVNVSGMDEETLVQTLFGQAGNPTCSVEEAGEGTLYLDDISALSDSAQSKLLQLIENGIYLKSGAAAPLPCRARLILSAQLDIDKRLNDGSFRKDFYFRLQSRRIDLQPLRDRPEDIPFLLNYLIAKSALRLGRPRPSFSPELVVTLMEYPFPGNVRELETLIDTAMLNTEQHVLTEELLAGAPGFGDWLIARKESKKTEGAKIGRRSYDTIVRLFGHFPTLEEAEDYLIQEALKLTDGNQKSAASLLDITRQTISRRMKKIKSPEDEATDN